jgi:CRISPR-associated RAMP protein (TIGR02581 family)
MFKKLYNQASISLSLQPDGPILIKAGQAGADPTRPDMEFVRTLHNGKPTIYLPGSSLKGVVRAHAERLARTVQAESLAGKLDADRLACDPLDDDRSCCRQWNTEIHDRKKAAGKDQKGVPTEELYRRSCFVCRLFGNTALASRLRIGDAYPETPPDTEERNGVAIDRVFGSVAVGPFNYEVATQGAFACTIEIRNFTIAQLGLLALVLRDLACQRIGVGFGKSRGLGRVRVEFKNFSVRYPACTLNGRLTLPGGGRPDTPPDVLPGAGMFEVDAGYGLPKDDKIEMEGVALTTDEWGEPHLVLTDMAGITNIWCRAVEVWRREAEKAVAK